MTGTPKHKKPNLLIIGAQKCGTTWLHYALNKSRHFSGSTPKEVNYWNQRTLGSFEGYLGHFPDTDDATYWYESTPHYFRPPSRGMDIAARIRSGLGDIPLILLVRNPVERYLSCYTHHMLQGRLPTTTIIETVSNDLMMVELGRYFHILQHFDSHFSDINIYPYDDIAAEPENLVSRIMKDLRLESDLTAGNLNFSVNTKEKNASRHSYDVTLPRLSPAVQAELGSIYRDDVLGLQDRMNRDLSHWLTP
ncbi:hypothetical protein EYF88_00865 [Paracoccus sediminis]|uniref:Sulfotransferase domain-containing protein n=1 Tax=Paracoccus sediminis TaxID=1214787 RepID=A0A238UUZ3_9RHOB|nr:sulfotransferase domain-containing protein [Paracoccus sediminis]TBN52789.1 hypothetical protein EYF88_00865 [Paracoccus sediminis]SNR25838.1 Sulfotransferase domain-containing protein [Paracoccus sediminis]